MRFTKNMLMGWGKLTIESAMFFAERMASELELTTDDVNLINVPMSNLLMPKYEQLIISADSGNF